MKFTERLSPYALGILLLCVLAGSEAATLGRLRGATIIGRPLDLVVPIQLEGADGPSALCVDADIFFGDAQLPGARVRVSAEAGSTSAEANIRIRTTSAVDEPVVTVYLREGCALKNTRKYVLLSDILMDSPLPADPVRTEAAPSPALAVAATPKPQDAPSAVAAPPVPAPPAGVALNSSTPGATQAVKRPRAERPLKASVTLSQSLPASATNGAGLRRGNTQRPQRAVQSRLKLDPVDLAAERDPSLRASSELLTQPTTDMQQREAANALWQAISAQPQDLLRDNQRLKALEGDLAALVAQSRQNQQALVDLKSQLEQTREQRYNNWLVYSLAALAALAAWVAGFLWLRASRQSQSFSGGPWWGKDADATDRVDLPGSPLVEKASVRADREEDLEPSPKTSITEVDVDLDVDESLFEGLKRPAASPVAPAPTAAHEHADFSHSLMGMPRTVNAEELFDIQQQTDFFISLGQFDQAVEVLRHHITDNVETSSLAYLDLFDLYHRLGRKDDYDLLRKDFNRVFNAQVPAFDEYTADKQGLDFYPKALSRIEALWPTPKVLDIIEESIFRKPNSTADAFNLTAYRELLLLYSVAKEIVERPMGPMDFELHMPADMPATEPAEFTHSATEFASTNIQPLSAVVKNAYESSSMPPEPDFDLTLPPSSMRLGLDIDLTGELDDKSGSGTKPKAEGDEPLPEIPGSNLMEFDADSIALPKPASKI